jgi:hypothetical protein
MKKYIVKKGLESPLLIKGVQVRHYYYLIGIGVVLSILILFALYGWISDRSLGSLVICVAEVIFLVAVFVGLYLFFEKQANPKKYDFKNEVSFISNKDILSYLN